MRSVPALGRAGFALFAAAFAVMVGGGLATRVGIFSYGLGVGWLLPAAVYLGLGAIAVGLGWLVARLRSGEAGEQRYGFIALAGAALLVAGPLYDDYCYHTLPPIHDITTDIANPPDFQALLALRKGAENSPDYDGGKTIAWDGKTKTVAEWQRKEYTDIFTLQLLTTPARFYKRALKAAYMMGWTVVADSPESGRIEATDTTLLFGVTSDIVIRVRPSGAGAKVDIRSESRMGASDAGRNASLIRAYLNVLKKRT